MARWVWQQQSLPTRGAWIEIYTGPEIDSAIGSLPTRGAWIEIARGHIGCTLDICRSPHGERGLKSPAAVSLAAVHLVAPHTGSVD